MITLSTLGFLLMGCVNEKTDIQQGIGKFDLTFRSKISISVANCDGVRCSGSHFVITNARIRECKNANM